MRNEAMLNYNNGASQFDKINDLSKRQSTDESVKDGKSNAIKIDEITDLSRHQGTEEQDKLSQDELSQDELSAKDSDESHEEEDRKLTTLMEEENENDLVRLTDHIIKDESEDGSESAALSGSADNIGTKSQPVESDKEDSVVESEGQSYDKVFFDKEDSKKIIPQDEQSESASDAFDYNDEKGK
jgi:hypothetical protein